MSSRSVCITCKPYNKTPLKSSRDFGPKSQSVEKHGVELDVTSSNDIKSIMEQCAETALSGYPPESFINIFWQQQLQAASVPNAKQRRWHPMMIKWALYLRHLSGKAYDTIRDSSCIALPSQRTLRDYTHFEQASQQTLTSI